MLGPGPNNYEFEVESPQKGMCTNGIAPPRLEKLALVRALQPVEEFEKKITKKHENRQDLHG